MHSANPVDPLANNGDDELYTLVPFLGAGDTQVVIDTQKPSNDEIIFFVAPCTNLEATIVVKKFCGDGNLDIGEQCDDGINVKGDGTLFQ